MTHNRQIAGMMSALGLGAICLATPVAAGAQTRTVRDAASAYGARLNAKAQPADINQNRINNRVKSRLDTRLSLRIERYRPDSVADPTAAFATPTTDNARAGVPIDTLPQDDTLDRPR